MPDLQGVSALFRAPDAAVMANQAIMASELAARQGSASLQIDAQRRESVVSAAEQAAASARIGGERPSQAAVNARARRRAQEGGESAGQAAPGPAHRIDLIA